MISLARFRFRASLGAAYTHFDQMSVVRAWSAAIALLLGASVSAQWLTYKAPGTPRLPDGRPNLAAPAPRGADGKPDLTGVWEVVGDMVMPTDGRVRSRYLYNIAADRPGRRAVPAVGQGACGRRARRRWASARRAKRASRTASRRRC